MANGPVRPEMCLRLQNEESPTIWEVVHLTFRVCLHAFGSCLWAHRTCQPLLILSRIRTKSRKKKILEGTMYCTTHTNTCACTQRSHLIQPPGDPVMSQLLPLLSDLTNSHSQPGGCWGLGLQSIWKRDSGDELAHRAKVLGTPSTADHAWHILCKKEEEVYKKSEKEERGGKERRANTSVLEHSLQAIWLQWDLTLHRTSDLNHLPWRDSKTSWCLGAFADISTEVVLFRLELIWLNFFIALIMTPHFRSSEGCKWGPSTRNWTVDSKVLTAIATWRIL